MFLSSQSEELSAVSWVDPHVCLFIWDTGSNRPITAQHAVCMWSISAGHNRNEDRDAQDHQHTHTHTHTFVQLYLWGHWHIANPKLNLNLILIQTLRPNPQKVLIGLSEREKAGQHVLTFQKMSSLPWGKTYMTEKWFSQTELYKSAHTHTHTHTREKHNTHEHCHTHELVTCSELLLLFLLLLQIFKFM